MSRLLRPVVAWWDRLSDPERAQWTAVAAAIAVFCVNWIVWSPWLIDDAAISFSFARHASDGEGWVAYPGGELVEGFSNPTWTAILTTLRFVGITPWLSAKALGLAFGVVTLPLAFQWIKEVTRDEGLLPCTAVLWLALSPQYAVWAASGLENGLWVWLLTVGSLAFLRELRDGGPPWSAVPMALLAITRPEGPIYVAVMAFTGAGLARGRPRDLLRIAGFTAITAGTWLAYQGYRELVFGWHLANTYYAKVEVGVEKFRPFDWGRGGDLTHGWPYLRSWAVWSTAGFLVPLLPVAATGTQGWRGQLGKGIGAVLALLLIPGAHWLTKNAWWPLEAEPEALGVARIGLIYLTLFALPWLGNDRPGHHARVLAWMLVGTLIAFTVAVGGDWMKGHRWLNHVSVPLAVVFADLLVTLPALFPSADPKRLRRGIFVAFGGFPLIAAVWQDINLLAPTETSPFDVSRRTTYMNVVQERLHVDHATTLDIDMGANMWWSGDALVDVAGLIDVPLGHRHWERDFIREYVFRERRPHFLHSHGHWHSVAQMGAQPQFRKDWVPIADYVSGPAMMHVGNHVRRDLLLDDRWEGTARPVDYGGRMRLEGFDVVAPVVPPGGTVTVKIGLRPLVDKPAPYRVVLVLSQGDRLLSWDLPPLYDWVPFDTLARRDVLLGTHSLRLPDDAPTGAWDVAVVLMDAGGVLPAAPAAPDPVFARGEARWSGLLEVAPLDTVRRAMEEQLVELHTHASAGRCQRAEDAFQAARRHLPPEHAEQAWERPEPHAEIGRCWAGRAQAAEGFDAEGMIGRARRWAHRDPEVRKIGRQLADQWEAEGDAAWAEGDHTRAYTAWKRALTADPSRSHLRVSAEHARDLRLGLEVEE